MGETFARSRRRKSESNKELALSVKNISQQMTATMDEELLIKGSEARARILEGMEDAMEAMRRLAEGITVQTFKENKNSGEMEEVIYSVPPYYPAIKYLLDWARRIVKEEPTQVKEHRISDEDRKLLREFMTEHPTTDIGPPRDGVLWLDSERNEEGVFEVTGHQEPQP